MSGKKTVVAMILILTAGLSAVAGAAGRYGLVVCARSGDQRLFDTNRRYVEQTLNLLRKAGIAPVRCLAEGGGVTVPGAVEAGGDAVAAELRRLAAELKPEDRLWIFFYGYANASGGRFSLATSGRRLHGRELAKLIGNIPAHKYIFCFNVQGYPLLELLQGQNTFVLSATSSDGQINPPLLPGYLLPRWLAAPGAPFLTVLRESARALQDYFKQSHLAVSESPVLAADGRLFRYPFETAAAPAASGPVDFALAPGEPAAIPAATPAAVPATEPSDSAVARFPASAAGKQAVAEAARLAAPFRDFPAVCLLARCEYTVGGDGGAVMRNEERMFIGDAAGAAGYSRFRFPVRPPLSEFRLLRGEVIYPDGSSARVRAERWSGRNGVAGYRVVFPGVTSGCLIRLETEFTSRDSGHLPALQRGFVARREIPVAEWELRFRSPLKKPVFFLPVNCRPERKSFDEGYSRVNVFRLRAVPACEPLRFDPPADELLARVMVSNTASWNDFARWAATMFEGTGRLDPATAALTRRLCAGATTDAARVRAIYEYLCNLRYETTPSGTRAFRPRTPSQVCAEGFGDCKDKANALVAMAALVGVEGRVALVRRGGRIRTDFPSWQFNHAVAWFPRLEGYPKGLWCDPTDTSTVFGLLPPGDSGCDAWVMNGTGGGFRTVRNPGEPANVLSQQASFRVGKDETFTGTVVYAVSGLMDYRLRQRFRRLTPQQRRQAAQDLVDVGCVGATVTRVSGSPVDRLDEPFRLTVEVCGAHWPLVRDSLRPPYDFWTPFAAAGRDRALFLNDGRPFQVVQTVRVEGGELRGGGEWRGASGPLKLSCVFTPDRHGREIRAEVSDGLIPSGAYPDGAALVRRWLEKMN